MPKGPTIKQMQESNLMDRDQAEAVKAVMNNLHNLTDILTITGWLNEGYDSKRIITKLRPYESKINNIFQGPTNIPRNGVDTGLRMIDKILDTHGVECSVFQDSQGYDIKLHYCNVGDMYTETITYSTAEDCFQLTCYADCAEEYMKHGYRQLKQHEM